MYKRQILAGVVLCFLEGLTPEGMLGNVLALGAAFTFAIVYLAARRTDCDALSYSYQGNLATAVLALYPVSYTHLKCSSRRPSVDLPQPDSPTSPSVSPASTCRETPSTASRGRFFQPTRAV